MFTKVLVLVALAAMASAAPAEKDVVPIVSQSMDIDPEGRFQWSYESGDGSKAAQNGDIKVVDKELAVGVHQGSFSYQGDDGKVYSVTYVADENGYQPVGEHLPVAPEIPAAIVRSLAYLATLPPPKN